MRKYVVFSLLSIIILSICFFPAKNFVFSEISGPGPTLNVTAIIEPCINITLSTDAIVFNCKGMPGVYSANQPVVVSVGSNCENWTVKCTATPLKGVKGDIPSDRIFVKNPEFLNNKDTGAGRSFEPMSKDMIVLAGAPTMRKETSLEFKLKTSWKDKAGLYTGQINYTYLANP